MNTFQCNINGRICIKRAIDAVELRKKIRATLLKQFGRYDDKKIDIKQIRNPHEENNVFNQLRHI